MPYAHVDEAMSSSKVFSCCLPTSVAQREGLAQRFILLMAKCESHGYPSLIEKGRRKDARQSLVGRLVQGIFEWSGYTGCDFSSTPSLRDTYAENRLASR
jgi:hypothetical protein